MPRNSCWRYRSFKKELILGGPVLLEVNGYDLALGKGVASKIEVEEIE